MANDRFVSDRPLGRFACQITSRPTLEAEFLRRIAGEPAFLTGTQVSWYLLDRTANVDPLYMEPDEVFGSPPPEAGERTVGQVDHAYRGPYATMAAVEFAAGEGLQIEPDAREEGMRFRSDLLVRVSRNELQRVGLVGATQDDPYRVPAEGDVMAMWPRGTAPRAPGVDQLYFVVTDSDQDGNRWSEGEWTFLIVHLKALTEFDPGRQAGLST